MGDWGLGVGEVQLAADVGGYDVAGLLMVEVLQFARAELLREFALEYGVGASGAAAEMGIAGGGEFEAEFAKYGAEDARLFLRVLQGARGVY